MGSYSRDSSFNTKTFATDYSRECEQEMQDLCDQMIAHIKLYINNYIIVIEETIKTSKSKKLKKLSLQRIGLLTHITENISRRTYDLIDVELIPRFFRDVE